MRLLDSLPPRPLRSAELQALRDADSVVEAAPLGVDSAGRRPANGRTESGDDDIRALAVQAGETIHGLGYEPGVGWTVVDSREADDPDDLAAVRDALKGWEAERTALDAEE